MPGLDSAWLGLTKRSDRQRDYYEGGSVRKPDSVTTFEGGIPIHSDAESVDPYSLMDAIKGDYGNVPDDERSRGLLQLAAERLLKQVLQGKDLGVYDMTRERHLKELPELIREGRKRE